MLDNKMYTFLKLCDLMNYRATAQELNMTQPAVTQHIQGLEREYGVKLFEYNNRALTQTPQGKTLEDYGRSQIYNEACLRQNISNNAITKVRIGATKTIGNYVLVRQIIKIAKNPKIQLVFIIENTQNLLYMLEHGEIDVAVIEGHFDKHHYRHQLLKKEKLVGVCAPNHHLIGRKMKLEQLFDENLVVREENSGTRDVLESVLKSHNYTIHQFKKLICVNSFEIIKELVKDNCGISFVYESVAETDKHLGKFQVEELQEKREFNFVYLKNTTADKQIEEIETILKQTL